MLLAKLPALFLCVDQTVKSPKSEQAKQDGKKLKLGRGMEE
jgi:hypothetical protein